MIEQTATSDSATDAWSGSGMKEQLGCAELATLVTAGRMSLEAFINLGRRQEEVDDLTEAEMEMVSLRDDGAEDRRGNEREPSCPLHNPVCRVTPSWSKACLPLARR